MWSQHLPDVLTYGSQVDLTAFVEKHDFVFDAVLNEHVTNDEVRLLLGGRSGTSADGLVLTQALCARTGVPRNSGTYCSHHIYEDSCDMLCIWPNR